MQRLLHNPLAILTSLIYGTWQNFVTASSVFGHNYLLEKNGQQAVISCIEYANHTCSDFLPWQMISHGNFSHMLGANQTFLNSSQAARSAIKVACENTVLFQPSCISFNCNNLEKGAIHVYSHFTHYDFAHNLNNLINTVCPTNWPEITEIDDNSPLIYAGIFILTACLPVFFTYFNNNRYRKFLRDHYGLPTNDIEDESEPVLSSLCLYSFYIMLAFMFTQVIVLSYQYMAIRHDAFQLLNMSKPETLLTAVKFIQVNSDFFFERHHHHMTSIAMSVKLFMVLILSCLILALALFTYSICSDMPVSRFSYRARLIGTFKNSFKLIFLAINIISALIVSGLSFSRDTIVAQAYYDGLNCLFNRFPFPSTSTFSNMRSHDYPAPFYEQPCAMIASGFMQFVSKNFIFSLFCASALISLTPYILGAFVMPLLAKSILISLPLLEQAKAQVATLIVCCQSKISTCWNSTSNFFSSNTRRLLPATDNNTNPSYHTLSTV